MLWDIHLEQWRPPTDDALLQGNVGNEANPKPIYISDTLFLGEKLDLIALIRETIDIFAWHYEDLRGLDLKVAVHHFNIKKGAKPVDNPKDPLYPDLVTPLL